MLSVSNYVPQIVTNNSGGSVAWCVTSEVLEMTGPFLRGHVIQAFPKVGFSLPKNYCGFLSTKCHEPLRWISCTVCDLRIS